MKFLLSFLSSGAFKWLIILIMASGIINFTYSQHRKIVDQEKQIALQEYNINQLNQTVKENQLFIQQMQEINKNKSDTVNKLHEKEKSLNDKLSQAHDKIKQHKDRESSEILKDVFKSLGEMQ